MRPDCYAPEGRRLGTEENRNRLSTPQSLMRAQAEGAICEAVAIRCDGEHHLHVALPGMEGIIPREEGAIGIAEGRTRDIALISRVGKPVCFTVQSVETLPDGRTRAVLSRREAQQRCQTAYLDTLSCGDILPARVTRLESFGAFCDVGCGLSALIPIAALSVSRIAHPSDRLNVGEDILAVLMSREEGRICLSQRELLGTWSENAARFSPGDTVAGLVRSVESYGVFVELAPNLAGLAEPYPGLEPGMGAGVYIKSMIPERMKIKLAIVDIYPAPPPTRPLPYFITSGHLSHWEYTPPGCEKHICSDFS